MRLSFLALLGALSLPLPAVERAMLDMKWVDQPVSSMAKDTYFERITDRPAPSNEKLRAVYCEHLKDWWGHLRVFRQSEDKVEWAAKFPADYFENRGHYIVSYRWIELTSTKNPTLEILESTHRGNCRYWILELVGREFRILLTTTAGGEHPALSPALAAKVPPLGDARFKENLEVTYGHKENHPETDRLKPEPGPELVTFLGKVILRELQEQNLSEHPYEENWTWDAKRRVFLKEK